MAALFLNITPIMLELIRFKSLWSPAALGNVSFSSAECKIAFVFKLFNWKEKKLPAVTQQHTKDGLKLNGTLQLFMNLMQVHEFWICTWANYMSLVLVQKDINGKWHVFV